MLQEFAAEALVWEWMQIPAFSIDLSFLKAPVLTVEVHLLVLTIENHFENR